ncbi:ATPase central domain-containing protein [Mycobacterium lentiflavum]|uniref:ATP-binding protein n=2 Tax=Mycobacterium simiae complex TaxID=2249310 RepID=A0A0E4H2Z5_MYCLN|nr:MULTISPECIES: ATP-binding protein [Mycobacterium simiae complex]ORJ54325.1 AAA family ATPase [Mycobacterium simiae]ULP45439.1 ATP-binding protein [Mycobacterium lentiflavum]CQD24571.1 ATPase central domain-containing protein [Mycobacterium lentiflavum]
MARSDLVVDLVEAQQRGDTARFRMLVEAIIAEERSNQHHLVADRLSELITTAGARSLLTRDDSARQVADLVQEIVPKRRLADVQMVPALAAAISEVIEEHHRSELLRSHGLEPRNRVLLEGPPGNGKTSLAEAVAAELMVPFYVVRYEGVVSSFLGETTSRLDHVFEFARTRRCVLFFDEFDTIAKERADTHETGEIKRVVSTLLLQIDRLPSHVVAICATNHGELLDRAAWRRFQLQLSLEPPSRTQATQFIERLRVQLGGTLGLAPRTLADKLAGASYADIEQFAQDVMRRHVLSLPDGRIEDIVRDRLKQRQATREP